MTRRATPDEIADHERDLRKHDVPPLWQPIETAPKDGTDIIVYRPQFDGDYIPKVGVDWWIHGYGPDGSWAKSRHDCQPTHWMPLPDPPSHD